MLSKIKSLFKRAFQIKIATLLIIVFSAALFSSTKNVTVTICSFLVFAVSVILFSFFLGNKLGNNIEMMWKMRSAQEIPMPEETRRIAEHIGASVKSMRILNDLNNALAMGDKIVVGKKLMDKLTHDEIQAVIAHELGHLKGKHVAKMQVLSVPFVTISSLWFGIFIPNQNVLFLVIMAYVMFMMIPLSWYYEAKADEVAARTVGKEWIKSALLKLTPPDELNVYSEDHPSTKKRIEWIDKIEINEPVGLN